jgi:hypothetical protein
VFLAPDPKAAAGAARRRMEPAGLAVSGGENPQVNGDVCWF